MVHIKTKEGASLWIALLATAIVAVGMVIQHIEWWITLCTSVGVFVVVALAALFIIRKYVAYKLKPIYSIVLSRDVHTNEIFSELKDKRVENIGEELTAWADTNDREIARLKEAECFRKQYLGNVAHELKTPIFNIQGYISTLLDGGLEDELINRKYLERAEKSIDRLINIVNDLDTISKLESSMNKLNLERRAAEHGPHPAGVGLLPQPVPHRHRKAELFARGAGGGQRKLFLSHVVNVDKLRAVL